MILRDYQTKLMAAVGDSFRGGHRKICVQAPTGAGKTAVMSAMVHRWMETGKRVLVLVPRRELAFQVVGTLERFGRYAGIIMAGEERLQGMQAYVASFDTLHARCVQREIHPLPPADVVIIDEAHLALAQTRRDIIDAYPDAYIAGFTATPARTDGRGLGQMFDDLVMGPSIRWLTDNGHLVPLRYFTGERPNLEGIRVNGDYNQQQLDEAVDTPRLVGDIVENWLRLAADRRTVVFCTSVKHSRHVCEQFIAAGVTAEHLDGNTPKGERDAILDRVRSGQTQILTNVYVASYGLDIPELSCAVMARPTKSVVLWYQTVGRILRSAPGKQDALLLDHAGCLDEHGFIDEPYPWTLAGNARQQQERERQERREPQPIDCPVCKTVFRATHICPTCGHELAGGAEAVPYYEVDLEEIDRQKKRLNRKMTAEEKGQFFGELKAYGHRRGYAQGWAAHKYRERFGVWPRGQINDCPMRTPSEATLGYIKHLQIKHAKSKKGVA
jgi:superfamily II DNA or RNA helicase